MNNVNGVYLSPLKSTTILGELDDSGKLVWNFSMYAELLIRNDAGQAEAAKALDEISKHLVVRWSRMEPYPHYRVTFQRYQEFVRAGSMMVEGRVPERIGEEEAESIRNGWMVV